MASGGGVDATTELTFRRSDIAFAKPPLPTLFECGQDIAAQVDESQAVDIELEPGEMSLHDVWIAHGSRANTSSDTPRGFQIMICSISGRVALAFSP